MKSILKDKVFIFRLMSVFFIAVLVMSISSIIFSKLIVVSLSDVKEEYSKIESEALIQAKENEEIFTMRRREEYQMYGDTARGCTIKLNNISTEMQKIGDYNILEATIALKVFGDALNEMKEEMEISKLSYSNTKYLSDDDVEAIKLSEIAVYKSMENCRQACISILNIIKGEEDNSLSEKANAFYRSCYELVDIQVKLDERFGIKTSKNSL